MLYTFFVNIDTLRLNAADNRSFYELINYMTANVFIMSCNDCCLVIGLIGSNQCGMVFFFSMCVCVYRVCVCKVPTYKYQNVEQSTVQPHCTKVIKCRMMEIVKSLEMNRNYCKLGRTVKQERGKKWINIFELKSLLIEMTANRI